MAFAIQYRTAGKNRPGCTILKLVSLLRLEEVTKDYLADGVRVRALDGVSLEAARGEFVALVGRSGCGKSTLLNLAGAMDFPTSGTVVLDGVVTSTLRDAGLARLRREKVGFVFQSFQLLPALSVVENVELPLMLAGRAGAREAALERLGWVEMDAFGKRMPYQLSGGQMQRVAIARALVHDPALLLADEPTGNLDTATGDAILALLRRITAEQRAAILMATPQRGSGGTGRYRHQAARRPRGGAPARASRMRARLTLFYRLVVRPLAGEPVRTALAALAVALGVAVVLAIELAGEAAAGSFRSSVETLAGTADFEGERHWRGTARSAGTAGRAALRAAAAPAHRRLRGDCGYRPHSAADRGGHAGRCRRRYRRVG